jgi:hypothetical protein
MDSAGLGVKRAQDSTDEKILQSLHGFRGRSRV